MVCQDAGVGQDVSPAIIILDFDGVIVESNGAKDEAFETLFSDFPEYLAPLRAYHLSLNAVDRFSKFRHMTGHILGLPPDEAERVCRDGAVRCQELTRKTVLHCPWVPGAQQFLEFFYGTRPLYLASATPQAELDWLVENRGLSKYFRGVYGAPIRKAEVLLSILTTQGIPAVQALFIGDSPEDWEAARDAKVPFIGRKSRTHFPGAEFPVFSDLFEILNYLRGEGAS